MTTSQIQVGYAIQRISDDVSLHYGEVDGNVREHLGIGSIDSVTVYALVYAFDGPEESSAVHFDVVEGALDDAFFCWLRDALI